MREALEITASIRVPLREIDLSAIRAQGAGGQHLHKTASAVQLRFDSGASSLPEACKSRLAALRDQRIAADGVIVIKAQRFRSLEQNREDALDRLAQLIRRAAVAPRVRRATKPSATSRRQRTDDKTRRGRIKQLRGRPPE